MFPPRPQEANVEASTNGRCSIGRGRRLGPRAPNERAELEDPSFHLYRQPCGESVVPSSGDESEQREGRDLATSPGFSPLKLPFKRNAGTKRVSFLGNYGS